MRRQNYVFIVGFAFSVALASVCSAQNPPAAPAAPAAAAPLSQPAITGPLSGLPPANFDAGPFGTIAANGILSGSGMAQGNHVPGDKTWQGSMSNGQVFIQKPDGWFQFYLQAGAYTLPSLATPFLKASQTMTNFYGSLPVAFVKLQAGKNTSFMVGALPTMIGAEYTFTFENMNIERGIVWNQENAVNRGIQVNQTMGKFTAAASWNDGFYSNRYSWLWGSLTYANGPHTLTFIAGGNLGKTAFQTPVTPLQNNSTIYNVIYTYNKNGWIIQPYFQYTDVPANAKIGVAKSTSTTGEAVLVNHTFKHGFSLPGRWEYISSSGTASDGSANLMFGPGSSGTSFTVTPTFQSGGFFFRTDIAFVHASKSTPGLTFGPTGIDVNQPRVLAEMGFIFGNNITK